MVASCRYNCASKIYNGTFLSCWLGIIVMVINKNNVLYLDNQKFYYACKSNFFLVVHLFTAVVMPEHR